MIIEAFNQAVFVLVQFRRAYRNRTLLNSGGRVMSASPEISLAHPLLPQCVGFLSGQEVPLKWYSLMIGRPVIWAMTSGSVWAQSLVTRVDDPTAFMEAFKKVSACAEIPMTCTSGRG